MTINWESLSQDETTKLLALADMGQMHNAPTNVLAPYCIWDCLSTLQLLDDVMWPVLQRFPELDEFHRDSFIESARLLWQQQFHGIVLDRPMMEAHAEYLRGRMQEAESAMRSGPMGPGIRALELILRAEHVAKEPPQFKLRKLGDEPARYTKSGAETAAWRRWAARRDAEPEVRLDWLKWKTKADAIERGELPEFKFNPASIAQLRRLMYDGGLVKWRATEKVRNKKGKAVPVFEIDGIHGWVELDGTEGGLPPMNGDLFSQLPVALAKPLQLYADAEQELGYCESYISAARLHPDGQWRIHPTWRVPGTLTGRLAGAGGINLQQCPKTVEFLRPLVPTLGKVWLESDASSLEPTVLAEITRDPRLMELYGPDARPHDVYLYNGTTYAGLQDEILPHYDLSNVTKEMVASAKKKCKGPREACKFVSLAKIYGSGAETIWRGLRLRGFNYTLEQARAISASHDEAYTVSGRQFSNSLRDEWEARGGFVLNGLGHPACIWEGKLKDACNRVVQATGHSIHTAFFVRLHRRLHAAGIEHVGIVWDFHDQLIIELDPRDASAALREFDIAVRELNDWLGGLVPIRYSPKLSSNMATCKEAEYTWTGIKLDPAAESGRLLKEASCVG